MSEAGRDDVAFTGKFRQDKDTFVFGKWFALEERDAAAWGRWFASRDGLRYYVVETELSASAFSRLTIRENLDNVGSAIFLTEDQFSAMPILSVSSALEGT